MPSTGTVSHATLVYMAAAVTGIAVAAVLIITIAVPAGDGTAAISAILGLVVPTVGVFLALLKIEQVHQTVNSSATALVAVNAATLAHRDAVIEAQRVALDDAGVDPVPVPPLVLPDAVPPVAPVDETSTTTTNEAPTP